MAGDLKDPKYQDPKVIEAHRDHIIEELVANFIANLPAEAVYHAAQARGFTWGAVRAPEALIGEHNRDIFCGELRLSLQEFSMLAESRVI